MTFTRSVNDKVTLPNAPKFATYVSPGLGASMPVRVPVLIIWPAFRPMPVRESSLTSQASGAMG